MYFNGFERQIPEVYKNIYAILVHQIIIHLKASDIAVIILYFVLKMWGMHEDDCN